MIRLHPYRLALDLVGLLFFFSLDGGGDRLETWAMDRMMGK